MEVIDNSPIFEPAVGSLVVEFSNAADLFEANQFYLTTDCDSSIRSTLSIYGWNYDSNINQYEMDVECPMPDLSKLPNLRTAIETEQANIVLALLTPCHRERYFIVARVEEEDVYKVPALMVYSAERITRHCMAEVVMEYAINEPDEFLQSTHGLFSTGRFLKEYAKTVVHRFKNPTFGMMPSSAELAKALNIDGVVTHNKRQKMLDNMDTYLKGNITKLKKDPRTEEEREERQQADAEIELIFKSIDPETMKRLFNMIPAPKRERAIKLIDPREVAKESTMILSIGETTKEMRSEKPTYGFYCLYFKNDKKSMSVHFNRRISLPLYLIYLIDKYKRDEVNSLDLRKHKESYAKIYTKIYYKIGKNEKDPIPEEVKKISEKILGNKNDRKELHNCLHDIKQSIYTACKEMNEIPSPYILETEYSHLFVNREKIELPEDISDLLD